MQIGVEMFRSYYFLSLVWKLLSLVWKFFVFVPILQRKRTISTTEQKSKENILNAGLEIFTKQ